MPKDADSLAAHHLLGVEGLGEGGERGVVHTTAQAEHHVKGGLLRKDRVNHTSRSSSRDKIVKTNARTEVMREGTNETKIRRNARARKMIRY